MNHLKQTTRWLKKQSVGTLIGFILGMATGFAIALAIVLKMLA